MLVDSHCHLDHIDLSAWQGSLDRLLEAARERGVGGFISVGVDLESSSRLLQLPGRFADVAVTVGVHPLQRQQQPLPEVETLVDLGSRVGVVAIGETGLDNHYSAETADWQRESFIRHLRAAGTLGKPVIVHTRQAPEETLDLIRAHGDSESGGVLHCFTEDWATASAAMDLNFYISFSGIITFRNASKLREVVKKMPLDRLLLETDSPWLAPVPHRGKQNEPQYVVEVAKAVAELKGIKLEEIASVTTANANRLFGLNFGPNFG